MHAFQSGVVGYFSSAQQNVYIKTIKKQKTARRVSKVFN